MLLIWCFIYVSFNLYVNSYMEKLLFEMLRDKQVFINARKVLSLHLYNNLSSVLSVNSSASNTMVLSNFSFAEHPSPVLNNTSESVAAIFKGASTKTSSSSNCPTTLHYPSYLFPKSCLPQL